MQTSDLPSSAKISREYPLVSIGLPTRNSHGKIVKTLHSLWEQHYPNLEVIVSDNCSTDDTADLLVEIMKSHPEIRYYRQPANIGLVPNFELVLKQATGYFFMWIADDDELETDVLKQYVDFLIDHSEYTLVSGQIEHWLGGHAVFFEKDFSIEGNSPNLRVLNYYSKVMYGAVFHGLMRKSTAEKIPLRNSIGNDFHFVATVAYLGKIKQFNYVSYHKELNGTSRTSLHYAKVIGASWFSAHFPRIAIARDAFFEILFRSPVYKQKNLPVKFILAASCCVGILLSYYVREFPFIVGGHLKRNLGKPFSVKESKET